MSCRVTQSIAQVPAASWNQLIDDDQPFCKHEFLVALELSGCVNIKTGWLPHHILNEQDDKLIAVMPFYIKGHSYGEYVFDWAWADAYHRYGYDYYPKGLCAIPFTPVNSKKIFIDSQLEQAPIIKQMVDFTLGLSKKLNLSSLHILFLNQQERAFWQQHDFLERCGSQFHWHNQNYHSFDHFLDGFTGKKRKKIRQDRKKIIQAGLDITIKTSTQISQTDWTIFYHFYLNTISNYGGTPYLNREFFQMIADNMADNLIMIQAQKNRVVIASALFIKGSNTLYGRYWGSNENISGLHFELCYYQAIEYCIANNLTNFEAGAQGGHKLARGLLPVRTYSAHWLHQPQFYDAVANYLEQETEQVDAYIKHLNQHSPIKHG